MDLNLANRVALVAGSSRGIGRAIARAFLSEGARVVVTGRNADALLETVAAFENEFGRDSVLGWAGDLSQPQHISRVVEGTCHQWGRIDCLVANVGSGSGKRDWQFTSEDWYQAFEVNFWTSLRLVDAVLPAMLEARGGSITLIGSIVGLESVDAPLPYSAAKSTLMTYSKSLARRIGEYGIRVNCVAPGNILFPGGTWEKKLAQEPDRIRHYIESEVPLQRFGTPEEIAHVVVFLASEHAAFITGACIVADGGQTRSLPV